MEGKKLQEKAIEPRGTNHHASAAANRPKLRKTSAKKAKRNKRPPRAVRLSQAERRYNRPALARPGVSVTVHIGRPVVPPKLASQLQKVRLPATVKSKLPKLPAAARPYRRPAMISGSIIFVTLVAFGLREVVHKPIVTTGKVAAAERTAPDFKPLVPSAAEASATTYDGKRDMLMYSSTFSGARLTVSQQPLPARFMRDPKALQAAADSLNAKQRLDTASGPIYIATNETNDQMALYAGKQVLLFIHTDRKLDDASWKSFIELLKEK